MHFASLLFSLLPVLALASEHSGHRDHRRQAIAARRAEEARALLPTKANMARSNEAHANAHRAIKKIVKKRGAVCRAKVKSSASATSTAAATSAASSNAAAFDNNWAHHSSAAPSSTADSAVSSTTAWSSAAAAAATSSASSSSSNPQTGLLSFSDATCGDSRASSDSPNGAEDWLNCGLDGAGWTPPNVPLDKLVAVELNANGIFSPCSSFIEKFKQYGGEFGIPPIMLASFAMQESTCNPDITGANGEAGLMQIAPPNCEAGQNCWDVDYNIRRGAQLFSGMIDSNGGNVLAAIGAYNGWSQGMTVSSGTAAASQGNCHAQNNLDYIHQFCNGWMQDKNAYTMGTYFNLASC